MFKKIATLLLAIVLILQTMPLSAIALADEYSRSDPPAEYELPYDVEEAEHEVSYDAEEPEYETSYDAEEPEEEVEISTEPSDWTDDDLTEWENLVSRLGTRASLVNDLVVHAGVMGLLDNSDALRELESEFLENFERAFETLTALVDSEQISFTDACAQINGLFEVADSYANRFEEVIWEHQIGRLDINLNRARQRQQEALSFVTEPELLDLMGDLMQEYYDAIAWIEAVTELDADRIVPRSDLNFIEEALEGIGLAIHHAENNFMWLEQLIWEQQTLQINESHSEAEALYLQAIELYEGNSTPLAARFIAPLVDQGALADLIAEYRAIVADLEAITEFDDAGRLVLKEGITHEAGMDATDIIIEQFYDLSLRLEELLENDSTETVRLYDIFECPILAEIVSNSLSQQLNQSINPADDIYLTQLQTLAELNVPWYRRIESLQGIEYLTGLNILTLNIEDPLVSNLSPLQNLTNLTGLVIWGNFEITDITPLENLINLTTLTLGTIFINDITPLANLTNLTNLILSETHIDDITPIGNLTNLRVLDLGANQLTDITPLTNLTNLTTLHMHSNQISDITPLVNLTLLTQLDLSDNQITNVDSIENLTLLTQLNLSNNQITDIDSIGNLTLLTQLNLSANQITNIDSIGNLVDLQWLMLDENKIEDINSLTNLESLEWLDLNHNQISDLRPIQNLSLNSIYAQNQVIYLDSVDTWTGTNLPLFASDGRMPSLSRVVGAFFFDNQRLTWTTEGDNSATWMFHIDQNNLFSGTVYQTALPSDTVHDLGDWTSGDYALWNELIEINSQVQDQAFDLWRETILMSGTEGLAEQLWDLFSEALDIILTGPALLSPPTLSFDDASALLIANTIAFEDLIEQYEAFLAGETPPNGWTDREWDIWFELVDENDDAFFLVASLIDQALEAIADGYVNDDLFAVIEELWELALQLDNEFGELMALQGEAPFEELSVALIANTEGFIEIAATLNELLQNQEQLFTLTVINGTGGGSFAPGTEVTISPIEPPAGYEFGSWHSLTLTFDDIHQETITFLMPSHDATVTANFWPIESTEPLPTAPTDATEAPTAPTDATEAPTAPTETAPAPTTPADAWAAAVIANEEMIEEVDEAFYALYQVLSSGDFADKFLYNFAVLYDFFLELIGTSADIIAALEAGDLTYDEAIELLNAATNSISSFLIEIEYFLTGEGDVDPDLAALLEAMMANMEAMEEVDEALYELFTILDDMYNNGLLTEEDAANFVELLEAFIALVEEAIAIEEALINGDITYAEAAELFDANTAALLALLTDIDNFFEDEEIPTTPPTTAPTTPPTTTPTTPPTTTPTTPSTTAPPSGNNNLPQTGAAVANPAFAGLALVGIGAVASIFKNKKK